MGEGLKQRTARRTLKVCVCCGWPTSHSHYKDGTELKISPISVWLKTMTCVSSEYVGDGTNIDIRCAPTLTRGRH